MGQCAAMRILVVRLSALGDIVQALPAITDLRRAHPQATIDVATDERFADIPRLHAGVSHVIPIALKRWKKSLLKQATWRELLAALRHLRTQRYDLVIDLHGLNKSAIVSWVARSKVCWGPSPVYCGEALAPRLYQRQFNPPSTLEPVPRMRKFVGLAVDRAVPEAMDFGLRARWCGPQARQVALIHSASTADKLWPEADWIALGQTLVAQGLQLVMPWGSTAERERAERLAQGIGSAHCTVGPPQSIAKWAVQLGTCRLVIGLDTGLTHLAAAAGVPCLALFTVTGASLFAAQDPRLGATLGGLGHTPTLEDAKAQVQHLLEASSEIASASLA